MGSSPHSVLKTMSVVWVPLKLLKDSILALLGHLSDYLALILFYLIRPSGSYEGTKALSNLIYGDLRANYDAILSALLFCLIGLAAFIGIPLLYKLVARRHLRVFISFSHVQEGLVKHLHRCMQDRRLEATRVPYQANADHQTVVGHVVEILKKSHLVVCVPGLAASYVEHEVLAANATGKPIVFLVSEKSGTLPNTADKRYPVFKLESLVRENFESLLMFVSYIGADLRSTWRICVSALTNNSMMRISRSIVTMLVGGVALLWFYCILQARQSAASVVGRSALPSADAVVASPRGAMLLCWGPAPRSYSYALCSRSWRSCIN